MAKISNLDFYAILGVHPNAEDIVIRAAFKALAQRYHPDRFTGSKDDAHRRMADLTNAYETLADPARRRKYDRRRGVTARTARFYFKNPARDTSPFGVLAARAAMEKQRRYRLAVYVLMVAVVILSAFNVHQHAPQIRELFASGRASFGTPTVSNSRSSSASAAVAVPDPSQPAATTANVRILPIGTGTTRPIGSAPIETPAPASASAPTPAAPTAPPQESVPLPAATVAEPPSAAIGAPPYRAETTSAPATADAPAAASAPIATAQPPAVVAAPPVSDAVHREAKRVVAKPAIARPATPAATTGSAAPTPSSPVAEKPECRDEILALGLCTRK